MNNNNIFAEILNLIQHSLMKTSFYLRTLFLCLLTLTFGCSGSDDSGSGDNGGGNGGGNNGNTITSISIVASPTSALVGETITFTVSANTGANLTSQSEISVDGNAISGNTFAATAEGTYSIVATYEALTSNTVDLIINIPPLRFNKNVLIEDYTGAWCGYCPRVSFGIERVEDATDQAVPVAIHRGNASGSNVDPYNFPAAVLENMIGLTGYPTAMLNRTTEWNYPEPLNTNQVINLTGGDAEIGLAMNSTLSGSNMSIEVNVKFGEDYSASDLKLVVYVLEDGLIYNQTNYTSYYGGGSVIVDFQHDHVLRSCLTDLLGDDIPSAETTDENVYTRTFDVPVPSNVSNSSNINVVAFVVGSDNTALNARAANFGDDQAFEEN